MEQPSLHRTEGEGRPAGRSGELDYLQALSRIAVLLGSGPVFEVFAQVAGALCAVLRFPERASARLVLGTTSRALAGFHQTAWCVQAPIRTPDQGEGCIEICYLQPGPWGDEGAFIAAEADLVGTVAHLISAAAARMAFERLSLDNTERRKELSGIKRLVGILRQPHPLDQLLEECCRVLPDSWQYPRHTGIQIVLEGRAFTSPGFSLSRWTRQVPLIAAGCEVGSVTVCCDPPRDHDPQLDPFLPEEHDLLTNVGELVGGAAASRMYESLVTHNRERLKELRAINQTTRLIGEGGAVGEILQHIAAMLPASWQYGDEAIARITFGGKEYVSAPLCETPWVQRESFVTLDSQVGMVEVFYTREFPVADEGPFLREERDLICNIARLVAHFLDSVQFPAANPGRELLAGEGRGMVHEGPPPAIIREVLVFSTAFEIFAAGLHGAGGASDERAGVRFTRVASAQEGYELLGHCPFDLVIVFSGSDREALGEILERIRALAPRTALQVLLTAQQEKEGGHEAHHPEKADALVWGGDQRLYDIVVGLARDRAAVGAPPQHPVPYLLVVEDDPWFRTRVLRFLCESDVLVPTCCAQRALRLPGPPQRIAVVTARTWEEALRYVTTRGEGVLALVSDVEFERGGVQSPVAGIDLARLAAGCVPHAPVLLLSSNHRRARAATEAGFAFAHKGSAEIGQTILSFVRESCGCGAPLPGSARTAVEAGLLDMIDYLRTCDSEGLRALLEHGGLARWLLLHGEGQRAAGLVAHDPHPDGLRQHALAILDQMRKERAAQRPVPIEDVVTLDGSSVALLGTGEAGGKGEGVAFLASFARSFSSGTPQLTVTTPATVILGTDEYRHVLRELTSRGVLGGGASYEELRGEILKVELTPPCMAGLERMVTEWSQPLAVRSSSLQEDSLSTPLAGVFDTYLIPNAHSDPMERLRQLADAVRLVFASQLRPDVQGVYAGSDTPCGRDSMAVVIQHLVGHPHEGLFYPVVSGVACTYNFYPMGVMQPRDGFAVLAFGLGSYVVEGRSGHRFCPVHPRVDFGSIRDLVNGGQVQFYALDTTCTTPLLADEGEKAALRLVDIAVAEQHGTLAHCASTYNPDNDTIVCDLRIDGPRVLDFADIIRHDYVPLSPVLCRVLDSLQEAMGTPVEIEFALDLRGGAHPSRLHLLQVRPLRGEQLGYDIESEGFNPDEVILYSESALGNGSMNNLHDVVVVNLENWDRLRTVEMVAEIEYFNRRLARQGAPYVLVGPGRWGTRDPALGVPVVWSQISHARVVVETALDHYPLDASLGSHFFHNVTAMNMGYLAVSGVDRGVIHWEKFGDGQVIERRTWFRHVRFNEPLAVRIDGKRKRGIVVRGWDA